MWSYERRSKILERLSLDGKVTTRALAAQLAVSSETIRRDFLELEGQGTLRRVHGGAVVTDRSIAPEPAFADRLKSHETAKIAIGRMAAQLIQPGSTLFVDAGTTTLAFARELLFHDDLRIITNSIEIATMIADRPNIEALLLGGKPHVEVPATYGELTLSEIERFLADFAVFSPVAYHPMRGAMSYALHEAEVARKMIRCSKSSLVLCHAQKVGAESRVGVCRPNEIDNLVTDTDTDPSLALPHGRIHFAHIHAPDAAR
jgi:DeoR/GlpR family transcriptional regulator of sugar metabolism